jgi:hypothetical protein
MNVIMAAALRSSDPRLDSRKTLPGTVICVRNASTLSRELDTRSVTASGRPEKAGDTSANSSSRWPGFSTTPTTDSRLPSASNEPPTSTFSRSASGSVIATSVARAG